MLAVKNVLSDGREEIIEAVAVSYGVEPKPEARSSNDTWKVLFAEKENGNVVILHYGIVYVTNSQGSTIATYVLNYPQAEDACHCGPDSRCSCCN